MCVRRLELTHAETLLIAHDHHDAVRDQRRTFELALAPTTTAAVERATGRTVSTFPHQHRPQAQAHPARLHRHPRRGYSTRAIAAAPRYLRPLAHRERAIPFRTINGKQPRRRPEGNRARASPPHPQRDRSPIRTTAKATASRSAFPPSDAADPVRVSGRSEASGRTRGRPATRAARPWRRRVARSPRGRSRHGAAASASRAPSGRRRPRAR